MKFNNISEDRWKLTWFAYQVESNVQILTVNLSFFKWWFQCLKMRFLWTNELFDISGWRVAFYCCCWCSVSRLSCCFCFVLSSVDSTGGSLVKVPRQGHGRMARAPNRWPCPWQSRKAETIRPVSSFATRKYVNEWIISRRPLPSHSQIGIGGQNGQTENIWERFIRKIGLWILKVLEVDTFKSSTINTVGQILNHFIWIDSP